MQKQIKKLLSIGEESFSTKKAIKQFYFRKYLNIWLNYYEIGGMDYQQRDFMLRKFWSDGRLACFKLEGTEGIDPLRPEGIGVFTPFAPMQYNIYDYPTMVNLINIRGVRFIPTTPQEVDKDVVIGFAQRNKHSILGAVDFYIDRIADVEMVIRTNLKAHKTPYIIPLSPEDENKIKDIINQIERDDPFIFASLEGYDRLRALVSGAPYILDKLYSYKCALENELKEYLGLNNLGNQEKKEHLITTEVNVNNEIIEEHELNFIDSIQEFFDNIKNVLGITYTIKRRNSAEIEDENLPSDEEKEEEEVEDVA